MPREGFLSSWNGHRHQRRRPRSPRRPGAGPKIAVATRARSMRSRIAFQSIRSPVMFQVTGTFIAAVSSLLPQNLQNRVLRVLRAVWLLPQNAKPLRFCGFAGKSGRVRGSLGGLGCLAVNEVQDGLFPGPLPPVGRDVTGCHEVFDRSPERVCRPPAYRPLCCQIIPDLIVLPGQGIADELHSLIPLDRGPSPLALARIEPGRGAEVVSVPMVPHAHSQRWRFLAIGLLDPQTEPMRLLGVGTFQVHQGFGNPLDSSPEGLSFQTKVKR